MQRMATQPRSLGSAVLTQQLQAVRVLSLHQRCRHCSAWQARPTPAHLSSPRVVIAAAAAAAAAPQPIEGDAAAALDPQQQQQQQQQEQQQGQHARSPADGDKFADPIFASKLYGALAAGLGVAGLLLGLLAPHVAAACLKLQTASPAAAATLVGCFGASLIRASSVCWSIKVGADAGQLATWRFQRLNISLAAAAAAIVLQQPFSWALAHPPALLLAAATAAAAAAACGRVLWGCRPLGGGVRWEVTGDAGLGGPEEALGLFWRDLLRTATSLPACLAALLAAAAAAGAWLSLLGGTAPAVGVVDPGVCYLRGLLAAGLVATAAQAAALVEYAQDVRPWTVSQVFKMALVAGTASLPAQPAAAGGAEPAEPAAGEQQQAAAAAGKGRRRRSGPLLLPPGAAPAAAFDALNLGLFASLGMQAAWLAFGSRQGLPLNAPDPVWALLYWMPMLGAVYMCAVVSVTDWRSVWATVIDGLGAAGAVLAVVLGAVFLDWGWMTDMRR